MQQIDIQFEFIDEAINLMKNDQYTEGIPLFSKVIKELPDDDQTSNLKFTCLLNRSLCFMLNKNLHEA
jgi:hypothetical protein